MTREFFLEIFHSSSLRRLDRTYADFCTWLFLVGVLIMDERRGAQKDYPFMVHFQHPNWKMCGIYIYICCVPKFRSVGRLNIYLINLAAIHVGMKKYSKTSFGAYGYVMFSPFRISGWENRGSLKNLMGFHDPRLLQRGHFHWG